MSSNSIPGIIYEPEVERELFYEQILKLGNVMIMMILPKKSRDLGFEDFSVARVMDDNRRTIWSFKDQRREGYASLLYSEEMQEVFIVIVGRGKLLEVIPIADLSGLTAVNQNGEIRRIGGRGIEKLLLAKQSIAKEHGLLSILTPTEEKVKSIIEARAAEEMKAAKIREEAEKAAMVAKEMAAKAEKEAAKKRRIQEILNRGRVEAMGEDKVTRFGVPVYTHDEWQILPNGTAVILMDDDNPLEFFRVKMIHGGRGKQYACKVSRKEPQVSQREEDATFTITDHVLLDLGEKGGFQAIPWVTLEEFKRVAATRKVNSGMLVAVPFDGKENKFTVYSMHGEKGCNTVGLFVSM